MTNTGISQLSIWLQIFAAMQLGIAVLNLFLGRIFHWKEELTRVSLLLREVVHVHAWFISATLAIFAVMTWRFALEMATGVHPMGRWLAAAIGLFWAIRAVLQITYYSSRHWRGLPARTAIHVCLLGIYGTFAGVYLWIAFPGRGGAQ